MELVQDIYVAYAFVHLEAKLNWCHMNRANTKTKTFIILMCNSIILNVQIFKRELKLLALLHLCFFLFLFLFLLFFHNLVKLHNLKPSGITFCFKNSKIYKIIRFSKLLDFQNC